MSALPKGSLRSAKFQAITAQMNAILETSDKAIVEPTVVEAANDPTPTKSNRFSAWIYGITEANYKVWEKTGSIKGSL